MQFSDGKNLSVYIRLAKTKLAKNTMKNFLCGAKKLLESDGVRVHACHHLGPNNKIFFVDL